MTDSKKRSVLVVGLGRFGSSVAQTLQTLGQDVLAVDRDAALVSKWADVVPTVEADVCDPDAVEQLDIAEFDAAVVAIGDSVESSVLVTGNLLDAGVSDVWAKSVSQEHARILQRIGARHIINAETDAGKRVGHLVTGQFLDYIEIEGDYTIVKILTPRKVSGLTIAQARIHDRYGVTVIGVQQPGHPFHHGTSDTLMPSGSELIILGTQTQIDRFIND